MSLRETIEAAKREAEEGGSLFFSKKAKEEEVEEETSTVSRRSTAAQAKPVRAAAGSVRVVSAEDAKAGRSGKKPSEMTKEERKAERAASRAADDLRNDAANVLLKQDEEYARTQKVWWILLGAGLVCSIAAFVLNRVLEKGTVANPTVYVTAALVTLVLAYILIIGAFIYDLIKARPIRRRVDEEVKGMTKKRLQQIVDSKQ